ncbi:MAG: hypothetical protein FWD61_15940 [Phycisphaerales bacterium]|nr:hypothetical protein [Phycisphaerales bacterium]
MMGTYPPAGFVAVIFQFRVILALASISAPSICPINSRACRTAGKADDEATYGDGMQLADAACRDASRAIDKPVLIGLWKKVFEFFQATQQLP